MGNPKLAGSISSFKGTVAAAGAARVLNLHALAAEDLGDPGYRSQPMFVHPVLNRSIIMKYNVPCGMDDKLAPRRFNSTKIVLPFDELDLDQGGRVLFVAQPDFSNALARILDYSRLPLDRDLQVLRILDSLSTLDPFLLQEALNQQRCDVCRCYFRLAAADQTQMLGFVAHEVEGLIRLCFGEVGSNDKRTQRLSQLLLAEHDSCELQPLRDIFRMNALQFSEAMFSWKAFLYYRWRSQILGPVLRATLKSLSSVLTASPGRGSAVVVRTKRQLQLAATTAWREIGQRLRLYDQAFASLTNDATADALRAFLLGGSSMVAEVGGRIGQVEQMIGFWNYHLSSERIAELSPEEIFDRLCDLSRRMSIGPGLASTPEAL
jgi:hypothetical protein